MRGILMVFVIKNEHYYGVKSSLSPLFPSLFVGFGVRLPVLL
ncbi:hypothetical protein [uncultured Gammaproteobacteria bacterium]|nr:hypothetical protein [uncultured Gammaproteobacteria bacterium]CAC9595322.1 hypothetical protein [uncultured Gammaproteobacteria bacterium]